MGNRKFLNNQEGFTLIEIIAVLVILGILAAVAVPKFMSLTDQAKLKSVEGALSSGLSTVSMQYARLSLSNDAEPDMTDLAKAAEDEPGGGDFSFTFTREDSSTIKVLAKSIAHPDFTASATWNRP